MNEINIDYKLNKRNNEEIPLDDLIFDYKCSNCQMYPIICQIFYCDKCQYYLCEDCEKKGVFHEHNLLVIESKNELKKIKDKENDVLDKNRKEKEIIIKQDNVQNPKKFNDIFNNYNYPNNSSNYLFKNQSNFSIYGQNNYTFNNKNNKGPLIVRNRGGGIFYYIK